jgi:hypothetical protein
MKKSTEVQVILLATVAAAAMAGCSRPRYDYSTEVRRCLDPQGNVVPDYRCEQRPGGYGTGGYVGYPRWVYGGTMNNGRLMNFNSAPTAGSQVVTPSGRTITRGGLGTSSSGRSGGGFFSGLG